MNRIAKKFLWIFIEIVLVFVVAYLFSIEAGKKYEWYAGVFHGAVVIPNYVISLFQDGYLYKATSFAYTYLYAWWAFFIFTFFYYVSIIFRLLLINK